MYGDGIHSLVLRPSHHPVFNCLQMYTASNHKLDIGTVFLARQVFMYTAIMATEGQKLVYTNTIICLHSSDLHLFVT